ncbi:toxin glutamine deamidase domain-containing protein [Leptospira meyeri]|uniref:toxin glutamine deamidase domain-containing protein n=1 Tax=Leptospira meyeri TaxID=29508 RepID=UPI001082616B|nr:toxin glutamine deamidase domain-containing protein [Leptospira meyeri]TGL15865.1 hypothetical protein EHQ50_03070 [Leptospira meyeri]
MDKRSRTCHRRFSPTFNGLRNSQEIFSSPEELKAIRFAESLNIVSIEIKEIETTVYNFEVEDDHTYFVTEAGIWVHNADDAYMEGYKYGLRKSLIANADILPIAVNIGANSMNAGISGDSNQVELPMFSDLYDESVRSDELSKSTDPGEFERGYQDGYFVGNMSQLATSLPVALRSLKNFLGLGKKGAQSADDIARGTNAIKEQQSFNGTKLNGDYQHTLQDINPGFPKTGRTVNCTNCVIALDNSLSGRPASALPLDKGKSLAVIEANYQGKFKPVNGINSIVDELQKAGPGSRGIVAGYRNNQDGHVFNVVNHKGKIKFLDGQTGGYADISPKAGYSKFEFLRTDK